MVYKIDTVDGVIAEIHRLVKQYEKAKKHQDEIGAVTIASSFQGSIISLEVLLCNIIGEKSYLEYIVDKEKKS